MKTTRMTTTRKSAETLDTDLLVYCLKEPEQSGKSDKEPPACDDLIRQEVENAFHLGDFAAKEDETLMVYPAVGPRDKKKGPRRILVMGMGQPGEWPDLSSAMDAFRKLGGEIAKICEKIKAEKLAVSLPQLEVPGPGETAEAFAEGILLGDYRFKKYKKPKKKESEYKGIKQVSFLCSKGADSVRTGMRKGQTAAQAACEARDMANEPGNGWTSKEFADYARRLAKSHGLTYTCLEKKEMKKLGMGGILAVNQGSAIPPRLVILEYRPEQAKQTLLLVGKGVTFDSGGISIKPASGMEEMKYDMCGGAAVLSTMKAVGEEKPKVGVVAIIPATDNMSGSSAVRPGDIIRHFNGVTAEIVNTDAEGRMILADALAYGIKTFQPDCVVDIATLTGAVIIGLGHHYAGLISNDDTLADRLTAAGGLAAEPVWRLPLNKDYKKQIKSEVADIKNVGGRPGGAITAAAYLSHFVGKTPWAHLDIAGTAWDFTKKAYIPKGPSGVGVRTFLNLIRKWDPELKSKAPKKDKA